jgi:hypothetical protein
MLDSKKKSFLVEVLGEKLAGEVIDMAEKETVSLEQDHAYKAISFAEYDRELTGQLGKNIFDVYKSLVANILKTVSDPLEVAEKLAQVSEEFTQRLKSPLSRRPGKPGKNDEQVYGVGYGYPPPQEQVKMPYYQMLYRQRKAERLKTIQELRTSRNPAAPYLADILTRASTKDAGLSLQIEALRGEGCAAEYVADLLEGKIIQPGAPIPQAEPEDEE